MHEMLLEYLMMMLFLFGLTTTVERNGGIEAFELETATTTTSLYPLPLAHQQQNQQQTQQQHATHQQHLLPSMSLSKLKLSSALLASSSSSSSLSAFSSQSIGPHHHHHNHEQQQQQPQPQQKLPSLPQPQRQQQQLQLQESQQQQQQQQQRQHHELSNIILDSYENPEPQFENTTEREVIAAVGTTARLHCRVRNLGDRAVSWIRKRDLHILTIGIMTYTNDQRFLARHIDNSDEWVLKVVSVQPRDAGVYECQVSTEPKISQAYKLMVVTSKAQILANRELFIQSGSDINLTCIAPQAPGLYTHMMWYKDSELVNDSPRGGIRVVSEQQMKTSNLVISRVLNTDSGNYTCAADNSNSDSVFVHIIKSEQHAAMQHELAASMQVPKLLLVLLTFFYFLECALKFG